MSRVVWLSLINHPLFPIALTLAAFQVAGWLYRRSGLLVLQPVLVSMLLVVGTLLLCWVDYGTYRAGAEPIALLLGPATVALAVPLQHNIRRIRQLCWPIMITLWVGGALSMGHTMAIGLLLGWAGVEHPAARA
ncbi:LrgB-like family protein [Pseudomonas borbori]|uniref:LrgB-like family protein n=1 Tax=Pseudomonas borbori TaxID=289003 RepID=A0A1I5W038_9PSED|nr:LrgB-like family protein [Pseudomonas borbori]